MAGDNSSKEVSGGEDFGEAGENIFTDDTPSEPKGRFSRFFKRKKKDKDSSKGAFPEGEDISDDTPVHPGGKRKGKDEPPQDVNKNEPVTPKSGFGVVGKVAGGAFGGLKKVASHKENPAAFNILLILAILNHVIDYWFLNMRQVAFTPLTAIFDLIVVGYAVTTVWPSQKNFVTIMVLVFVLFTNIFVGRGFLIMAAFAILFLFYLSKTADNFNVILVFVFVLWAESGFTGMPRSWLSLLPYHLSFIFVKTWYFLMSYVLLASLILGSQSDMLKGWAKKIAFIFFAVFFFSILFNIFSAAELYKYATSPEGTYILSSTQEEEAKESFFGGFDKLKCYGIYLNPGNVLGGGKDPDTAVQDCLNPIPKTETEAYLESARDTKSTNTLEISVFKGYPSTTILGENAVTSSIVIQNPEDPVMLSVGCFVEQDKIDKPGRAVFTDGISLYETSSEGEAPFMSIDTPIPGGIEVVCQPDPTSIKVGQNTVHFVATISHVNSKAYLKNVYVSRPGYDELLEIISTDPNFGFPNPQGKTESMYRQLYFNTISAAYNARAKNIALWRETYPASKVQSFYDPKAIQLLIGWATQEPVIWIDPEKGRLIALNIGFKSKDKTIRLGSINSLELTLPSGFEPDERCKFFEKIDDTTENKYRLSASYINNKIKPALSLAEKTKSEQLMLDHCWIKVDQDAVLKDQGDEFFARQIQVEADMDFVKTFEQPLTVRELKGIYPETGRLREDKGSLEIQNKVVKVANNYGVPESLALALVYQESTFIHYKGGKINVGVGGDDFGAMQINKNEGKNTPEGPGRRIKWGCFDADMPKTPKTICAVSECQGSSVVEENPDCNIAVGMKLLSDCYKEGQEKHPNGKMYDCKNTMYSGWDYALRCYNGWAKDCSGDPNYVQNVQKKVGWFSPSPILIPGESTSEGLYN
ncbi:hypothetical protein ACFL0W_04010 [Nanoarchaeota archaeon]